MDWPVDVKPDIPLEEVWEDQALRSEFEAGYEQTRARYTRSRQTFKLHWGLMPTADKEALRTFWGETLGGSTAFSWTHPVDATVHQVRFASVPKVKLKTQDRWTVDVVLREV